MDKLYIIRHGIAGERLEDEKEDELRSLTKKGKKEFKAISKELRDLDVRFDEVISSPLIRALETAEIAHKYCSDSNKIVVSELLRPDGSYTPLIQYLNKLKAKGSVAIVGHEPFLSIFASYCLTNTKDPIINLKKGGVLALEIDKMIKPGNSKLLWLLEPKFMIPCEKN